VNYDLIVFTFTYKAKLINLKQCPILNPYYKAILVQHATVQFKAKHFPLENMLLIHQSTVSYKTTQYFLKAA